MNDKGANTRLQEETGRRPGPALHKWGNVERVQTFKFLGALISVDLSWSTNTIVTVQ